MKFANKRKTKKMNSANERNYETVEARKIFRVKSIYKCGKRKNRICKSNFFIYKCGCLNNRICKSSALIYKCDYTNNCICKSKRFDLQMRLLCLVAFVNQNA